MPFLSRRGESSNGSRRWASVPNCFGGRCVLACLYPFQSDVIVFLHFRLFLFYVTQHWNVNCPIFVIPIESYTAIQGARLIFGECIRLSQSNGQCQPYPHFSHQNHQPQGWMRSGVIHGTTILVCSHVHDTQMGPIFILNVCWQGFQPRVSPNCSSYFKMDVFFVR